MWELDHKEGWGLKNWCFRIVVLEKTLESPLDSKGIKPVNPKGNQPWIFIGRTDAEAETPILWPQKRRADSLEKTLKLERLKAGGEGSNRGWDGWMASPAQCSWVWAISGRWWRTGKPGVLQPMGSQRVRHDWDTEQQQRSQILFFLPYPITIVYGNLPPLSYRRVLLGASHHAFLNFTIILQCKSGRFHFADK